MFKHFGTVKNSAGQYNAYDHKKVLQDYLKFNKTELTEDEMDLIEIYSIFEDTKDPELLKQLDKFLSERDDEVTPLVMKTIDNKVVENYKREFVESLIKIEQARQKAADPEDKSYRYICKKNGDICYPTSMYCESDGSTRYKDHIQEREGDCIYQYIGKNGERVTKRVSPKMEEVEMYEIEGVILTMQDGTPFKGKISITMKDGQIEEYFFPIHENSELYGLKKKRQSVEYEDGLDVDTTYEFTQPHPQNSNHYLQHYIVPTGLAAKEMISKRRILNKENHQLIEEIPICNWEDERAEENIKWRDSVLDWKKSVESYLTGLVQAIEKSTDENETEPYYEVVPQYDPNEVAFEDGDIEGFVLYGVHSSQLCVSMQRGGLTSEELSKNKLFKGNRESYGGLTNFTGHEEKKIHIEKFMEGGMSTTSSYYNFRGSNGEIGLGTSGDSIDPNAIVGYSIHDAGTTHIPKRLKSRMERHGLISDILSDTTNATRHAEIATLRYPYNINKIEKRNCWG